MFSCKPKIQMTEEQKKQLRWQKEIELLSHYNINVGVGCYLFDYPVQYKNKTYKIHTFCGGENEERETLLLIHGYGGSNIHYSRIYHNLMKDFRVYSIDLPGMGYSSKKDIVLDTYEETLDFFMGTISQLIKDLFNKKIILIGHSFGGFIAAHLLIRFKELFSQVFLLSPAGTTYYDETEIQQKQDFSNLPFLQRTFFNYAKGKWNEQMTPQTLKEKWYGNYFIKRYLKKRMQLKDREYELWQNYVDEMLNLPQGSEKALFILLQFPRVLAKGWDSIEYILTREKDSLSQIPIYFYFGDEDWMDKKGAYNLANNIDYITVRTIQNAGHQLNFENPQGVYEQLIHDLSLHTHRQTNKNIKQQYQQIMVN